MANYLIYPMKVMKISQGYSGNYSHAPHSAGTPKDYPWDEAGADSGREYCYCPCDKMKIVKIYGVGASGTNTIWLESTSKVDFADGTNDYVTILITHPNDDDLKKLKKGQTFTRGQQICREGTDGRATGNHFHFAVGKGKMTGTGWTYNTKRAWVISTTNGSCKPEAAFYIDKNFTKVINNQGLKFKTVPDSMIKFLNETGITSEAAYSYFFTDLMKVFGPEFEKGTINTESWRANGFIGKNLKSHLQEIENLDKSSKIKIKLTNRIKTHALNN